MSVVIAGVTVVAGGVTLVAGGVTVVESGVVVSISPDVVVFSKSETFSSYTFLSHIHAAVNSKNKNLQECSHAVI